MMIEESSGFMDKDYPFEYARISARKAKLFDRSDYQKMSRMGPNELANHLKQNGYREEVERFSEDLRGVRLVEKAADQHFADELNQIRKTSADEIASNIEMFARRFDVKNLKRFVRWKQSGKKSLDRLLTPLGNIEFSEIDGLENKSLNQILSEVNIGRGVNYEDSVRKAEDPEKGLEEAYRKEIDLMIKQADNVAFRKYLRMERKHREIVETLRRLRYGMETGEDFSSDLAEYISSMDFDTALEHVVSEMEVKDLDSLRELERSLESERLEAGLDLVNKDPLGATPVYGYLLASQVQARNLKVIANSTELGKSQDDVMSEMVFPE